MKLSIKTKALLELSFAGILWGFGFIGTVWALKYLSPSAVIFYRFLLAFIGGAAILAVSKVPFAVWKNEFKLSLIPAIVLLLTLLTQTMGLQYTTATNSTFITTLYVVLVPLFRALTKEERLSWVHWFCVLLALLGTGFIVEIQKLNELNWGDLLTLICAIFAALHILVVGQRALRTQNDFAFNTFQSFWISVFSLLAFPFTKGWSLQSGLDTKAWIGILSLGFGSSMIAFYLQVRSQKDLSPSVASLLFLLESPSSCFFAYLLLGEQLNSWQWVGACLILISCALISLTKDESIE